MAEAPTLTRFTLTVDAGVAELTLAVPEELNRMPPAFGKSFRQPWRRWKPGVMSACSSSRPRGNTSLQAWTSPPSMAAARRLRTGATQESKAGVTC